VTILQVSPFLGILCGVRNTIKSLSSLLVAVSTITNASGLRISTEPHLDASDYMNIPSSPHSLYPITRYFSCPAQCGQAVVCTCTISILLENLHNGLPPSRRHNAQYCLKGCWCSNIDIDVLMPVGKRLKMVGKRCLAVLLTRRTPPAFHMNSQNLEQSYDLCTTAAIPSQTSARTL